MLGVLPSLNIPMLFVAGSQDQKFVQLGRAMAGVCEREENCVSISTDNYTGGFIATDGGAQSRAVPIKPAGDDRSEAIVVSERDGRSSAELVDGVNRINGVFREVVGSGHAVHSERPEVLLTLLTEWCGI